MDEPQETPDVSPTDLPLGYLASSLAQLLEVARRELEAEKVVRALAKELETATIEKA